MPVNSLLQPDQFAHTKQHIFKITFDFVHSIILLTHWGRVAHKCVSKLTIIGSDNGLSTGRRQAIIWTNHGILLIRPLGTNFSEILSEIHTFSFKKMHLKTSSAKWRPFCLGLNVLRSTFQMGIISLPLDYLKLMLWLLHNFAMMWWFLSNLCKSDYLEQPKQYRSGAKGARNHEELISSTK